MNESARLTNSKDWKWTLGLILLAYLFSVGIRMIWVQWASGFPEFYWHGQLMINTNDGYAWASGAQKVLDGTLQHNPRVPDLWYTATVTLSYFAAKFLPFSLDTVILYMPTVISSLVVIPLVLIGRLYGMTIVGFFAALLGSVTWSYYNRTMTGYYDTDMFSAMAPMFIVYFLLAANHRKSIAFALMGALSIVIYPFLYNQGRAMIFAISVLYIFYVWAMHRKETFAYPSIAIVAAAMLPVWWPLKVLAVLLVYGGVRSGKLKDEQTKILALGLTALFLLTGDGVNFIYHKVMRYAERDSAQQGLHFFNVVNTIREAGHIPFDLLAKRISGSVPGFFLALVGYMMLLARYRAFVITLPLMGLGLFAWWGGLRFTVYAVPVAALGLVYLFYVAASYLKGRTWQVALPALLTGVALYPNITHIIGYKVPTVFNKSEVEVLDRLKKLGSDKDYVITWWDYGYPIWYYGDKNTLIDGAKHSHDNFIVSEILTTDSQLEAARLSRIAVETYVNSGYKTVADTIFKNGKPDQVDPNEYLAQLRKTDLSVELPSKSRDVYLYLPWRMNAIFPTVSVFSNIDLTTGRKKRRPLFMATVATKNTKDRIYFGNGAILEKSRGTLLLGKEAIPLKAFVVAQLARDGHVAVRKQSVFPNGPVIVLFAKDYGRFFILDERMYNSTYVKLFFLGEYDPKLFEPVVISPWAKVFRVKL